MKKLLLALALYLLPSVAWAQNPQCPDRPAASNDNSCANTRWVKSHGGSPGGTNGQIQYNNNGVFGGESQVTTTQGGTGISNATNTANDVLASNGANGSFVHTALITLLNTICTASPTTCGTFFGYLNVAWYSPACNGSTDDHTPFQNAINAGISSGLSVRFTGNCKVTTQVSITGSVDFGGSDPSNAVISAPAGVSALLVNTQSSVYLHDFGILYAAANASDTALTVTATTENGNSRFTNLAINGPNIGINFIRASTWVLSNSLINAITANGVGVLVQNTNNPDSGDSTIYGNYLGCAAPVTCTAAIEYTGSGGLRVENNKTNGAASDTTGWTTSFFLNLASGANTGDLWIVGNSFEGLLNSGSVIELARAGATGSFIHIVISANELGGGQLGVNALTDANGAWLSNIVITGNSVEPTNTSSTAAYNFGNAVSGLTITGGVTYAPGGGTNQNIILSTQTATNCAVGPIAKVGTFAANVLSSCTSISPN